MAVISRILVDHPALGTSGGAPLHAQIEAIYKKLGDNINDRFFYVENLANLATADVEHNFRVPLDGLRYDVYAWDTGTQELTLLTASTTPTRAQIPVTATPGFTTTQARLTNNSGAERDLVIAIFQDPIELDELTDVDLSTTPPTDGQALAYDGGDEKWKPATISGSAAQTVSGETIDVSTGTLFHCTMTADKNFTFTNMVAGKAITVLLSCGDAGSYQASFNAAKVGGGANVYVVSSGRMLVLNFKFSSTSKAYADDVPRYSLTEAGFSKLRFVDGGIDNNVLCACVHSNHLYVGGEFVAIEDNGPNSGVVLFNQKTGAKSVVNIGRFGGALADGVISAVLFSNQYIYVAGVFSHYDGVAVNNLVRLHAASGKLDTTFNVLAFDNSITCLAIDSSGLYVGGQFTTYDGNTRNRIVKLSLTDASDLNATFAAGTGFNANVLCMSLNSSGNRLTIGGEFTTYQGNTRNRIAQLNATTAADNHGTFAASTGFNSRVRALAWDGSNGLFVGGDFTTYIGNTRNRIAKLHETTAADQHATFAASTGFDGNVRCLAYDSSTSRIYVGGEFANYIGNPRAKIAALHATTAADQNANFAAADGFPSGIVAGFSLEPSTGCLFVAGTFSIYRGKRCNQVIKLNPDASIDDSFKASDSGNDGFVGSVSVLALNGASTGETIAIAGAITYHKPNQDHRKLVKINLDTMEICQRFRPNANGQPAFASNAVIKALAADSSGLYVGGSFSSYRGVSRTGLLKLNLDTADEDATFNQGTGLNAQVLSLALDSSYLYVGGQFSTYQGNTRNRILKLDKDTAADQHGTFAAGTGFNGNVEALVVDSSYLYCGGSFSTYQGNTRGRIAKLDKTTAADQHGTFAAGTGFNSQVTCLALHSGYLFVGGVFTSFNGNTRNLLVKLDATTAADQNATFAVGSGFDQNVMGLATDGTYLWAVGWFITYQGNSRLGIVKLDFTTAADQNGTFDASVGFNDPTNGQAFMQWVLLIGTALFTGGLVRYYRNRHAQGFSKLLANDGTIVRDSLT